MKVEVIKLSEKHFGIIDSEKEGCEYISCCNVSCGDDLPCFECIFEKYEYELIRRDELEIKEVEF